MTLQLHWWEIFYTQSTDSNMILLQKHPHRHTLKCLPSRHPLAQMSWHIKLTIAISNPHSPESATDFCIEGRFGESQGFPDANHLQEDKPQVHGLHYLSLLLLWFSYTNDGKNFLPWPRNNVSCHLSLWRRLNVWTRTPPTLHSQANICHENPEKLSKRCVLCWAELFQPRVSSRWNFYKFNIRP